MIRSTTVAAPHLSIDPPRCRHWPRTFFAESVPLQYSTRCENKNPDFLATFLRLGIPFHPDNAAISLYTAIFAAFLGSNSRLMSLQQSLIAKSCNQGGIFVSELPRQLRDGAVSKVCPAALRAASGMRYKWVVWSEATSGDGCDGPGSALHSDVRNSPMKVIGKRSYRTKNLSG